MDSKLNKKPSLTGDHSHYLQKQAHTDLTLRGRGGIVIYLTIWLITALWSGIYQTNPVFFSINTLLFIIVAVLRSIHYLMVIHKDKASSQLLFKFLITLILLAAIHWGILSTIIIYSPEFSLLHYVYMIIMAAFAIGGTAVLSISRIISIFYPLFIFIPTLIVGFLVGGEENYVLIILALLSILYVFEASRISHNDYHKAIFNHKIAKNRALEMEKLSVTDPLTKLKNRLYFNNQLTIHWNVCKKNKKSLSLIILDLDHFKIINDTFGHSVGDQCLVKVAEVLTHSIQLSTDTVARFGGEEFIILLPETEINDATKIANQVLLNISEIEFYVNDKPITIKCSLGVSCTIPSDDLRKNDLIVSADNALYQAKSYGRNQTVVDNSLVSSSTDIIKNNT